MLGHKLLRFMSGDCSGEVSKDMETKSGTAFQEGDEVVLARGSNRGTPGRFLRLRPDPRWAEITERNGVVKMHPTEWLAHVTSQGGSA